MQFQLALEWATRLIFGFIYSLQGKLRQDAKKLHLVNKIINSNDVENSTYNNRNENTPYAPVTPAKPVKPSLSTFTPKTMRVIISASDSCNAYV